MQHTAINETFNSSSSSIVILGENGEGAASNASGVAFVATDTNTSETIRHVTYSANIYVAAGDSGSVSRSGDGTTWEAINVSADIGISTNFTQTTYSSVTNTWVAVAKGGNIIYSTDRTATQWQNTSYSSTSSTDINSVTSIYSTSKD